MKSDELIITAEFPENRKRGLLLCGINAGYSLDDEALDRIGEDRRDAYRSFFSDAAVNRTRFRNRIVLWFELLGLRLEQDARFAAAFERSIVQTNWIAEVTRTTDDFHVFHRCIAQSGRFLDECERLQPGLVILFGREMLDAFVATELLPRVEQIFGPRIGKRAWISTPVAGMPTFRVGLVRHERVTVISLPHLTARRIAGNAFIAEQRPVSEEIARWWTAHQAMLAGT